jgi:serine protease
MSVWSRTQAAATLAAGTFALLVPVNANDTATIQAVPLKQRPTLVGSTDRIIIRLHDSHDEEQPGASGKRVRPMSAERSRTLGVTGRTLLTPVRRMGSGAQVVRLTHDMPLADVEAIVERLKRDPAVAHAEPDRRKQPLLVPTDPSYPATTNNIGQWNLRGAPGGINAEGAWDFTQGSNATVVAVLDTGILPNIDLNSRIVAGYDFIDSDAPGLFATANDSDGPDANPADPGNWVSAGEAGQFPFAECPTPQDSDWHGTHTAGIIAASANNGYGITGINWNARIQMVRVLGKCGGYTSDIVDGLRWAAGLAVPGAPNNPTPANVINMSLGGTGACSTEEQTGINEALGQPSVKAIVTAAGNDATTSTTTSPGNCLGVITVTAHDINGANADYANVGANVTISAPGGFFACGPGGCNPPADRGILSLFNNGTTVPGVNGFAWVIGTSEAAAHVSGVASLLIARNPALSQYQVKTIMQQTARPHPAQAFPCTTQLCGAGLLDAAAAVQAAAAPPSNPASGGSLVNVGSGSGNPPASNPPPASVSGGGGGGGGGGCTIGDGTQPDWLLALFALVAFTRLTLRQRKRIAARG